jgi:hypothetical protein
MHGWLPRIIAVLVVVAPAVLVVSTHGQSRENQALEISNFTIEPPVASPGGIARIRFEFRGARDGLKAATLVAKPASGSWRTSLFEALVNQAIAKLGNVADGVVEVEGRHQSGYAPAQHGTVNLYELRVIDRAGRQSNALTVSLPVRL